MPKEGIRIRSAMQAGAAIGRDNRFLEEGGAPLNARLADGAPPVVYQQFRWPGSREGRDGAGIMANVDAYRAMRERDKGFETLYANMAYIRNLVVKDSSAPVLLEQLLEMTSLGRSLPLFLLYRSDGPFDPEGATPEERIPESMADMYKTFRGLHTAAINLAIDTYDPVNKTHDTQIPVPTPEEIYAYIDRLSAPRLTSADRTVGCPAPKDVIVNAFTILLTGKDTAGNNVSAEKSDIPDYLTPQEEGRLYDFSRASTEYELISSRLRRIAAYGLENLARSGIDVQVIPLDILPELILSERAHSDLDMVREADRILFDMGVLQLRINRDLGRTVRRDFSRLVEPKEVL